MSSVPSLLDSKEVSNGPANHDLNVNDLTSHPSSNLIIGESSIRQNNLSKQPSDVEFSHMTPL